MRDFDIQKEDEYQAARWKIHACEDGLTCLCGAWAYTTSVGDNYVDLKETARLSEVTCRRCLASLEKRKV